MNSQDLLVFMRTHRVAAQSSVSPSGVPQAAVVGVAFTDRFEIVFDTVESTRKAGNLRQNPAVAFVIGGFGSGDERTVQYEGLADVPPEDELPRLKQVYYAVYPDGPGRLSWPGIMYVRVRPSWIRYSDYTHDPPRIVEFTARELAAEGGERR